MFEPYELLLPWEFSPTVLLICSAAAVIYARGLLVLHGRGEPLPVWRAISFFVGLGLIYAVLQTHYDYYAQYMFWVHRLQHGILHHIGPFLIALAAPLGVMRAGLSARLQQRVLAPLWHTAPVQGTYRILQNPVIAPTLFVGLIYFWLIPSIHFDAMLSLPRYHAMNWSMAIDGLLFWWLMLDPHVRQSAVSLSFGWRILILWLIIPPQIVLGAYITLTDRVLFDVYDVCGRAWAMDPMLDQQIGGLLTWIPPSMMSVIGMLVVLRFWMRSEERGDTVRQARGRIPVHGA